LIINSIYIHFPYLTISSVVENGNITFIGQPIIDEQFSPYYQVLKSDVLNAPVYQSFVASTELNSAELVQISNWKPETIG
jgi:hypothetical protein